MEDKKFYFCAHCGKLIGLLEDPGVDTICCGDAMQELVPHTTDEGNEKHLPVASISDQLVTVDVGSVPHPMLEKHFIQWIYLQTKRGGQRKALRPGEAPRAVFALYEDEPVAVFEYCNLHGLWKTAL